MRREILNAIQAWMGSQRSCFSVGVMFSLIPQSTARIKFCNRSTFYSAHQHWNDLPSDFFCRFSLPTPIPLLTHFKSPLLNTPHAFHFKLKSHLFRGIHLP